MTSSTTSTSSTPRAARAPSDGPEAAARADPAGGAGGGPRRRQGGPRVARPTARGESLAPVPAHSAPGQVRPVRRVPLEGSDIRPGAPAARRRLPPDRRGPPGLDRPVRRDACPARGATLLVPRQRAIHVHLVVARAADPPAGRAAAGVARGPRCRGARPVRPRGRAGRCGLRPDAGGNGQRATGPPRAVPTGRSADRAPHRREDRAAGDGRDGGAVHRAPAGISHPAAHVRARAARRCLGWRPARTRLARRARAREACQRGARSPDRPGRGAAVPRDDRPAVAPAPLQATPDVAPPRPGPPGARAGSLRRRADILRGACATRNRSSTSSAARPSSA